MLSFRNKKMTLMVPVATALVLCFQNCSPLGSSFDSDGLSSQSLDPATYQALEDQVASTLSNRCVACHSSLVGNSNLPYLDSIEDLKREQIYVKRQEPHRSAIYVVIISGSMPENGPNLTVSAPLEVAALRDWIQYMP